MMDEPHQSVVLFYKYFIHETSILSSGSSSIMTDIETFIRDACTKLHMRGRILLAVEGINGTLSTISPAEMQTFIDAMENYEIKGRHIFTHIDWKMSAVDDDLLQRNRHPFPDLKISIAKEIVSTGNVIPVHDIPKYGGKHLSPEEFHGILQKHQNLEGNDDGKELVVIDVRNTFEHAIGHFRYGHDKRSAMNPKMVTFSSFDAQFCATKADYLRDKKILIYCTGGIRCEKASVMLRKRGIDDVSQLSGGVHRYMERFPDDGFFQGRNFVFDQRVSLSPSALSKDVTVVGNCVECGDEYDEISGSRLCTVCRDLVLICPQCVARLREYHCGLHSTWKHHYFTFLDTFDEEELREQMKGVVEIRNRTSQKNTRKTLMKQMTKMKDRIESLDSKQCKVERDAPRRCRTCHEPESGCDGLCWGFWKQSHSSGGVQMQKMPIAKGYSVRPGPDWNETRFGKKIDFNIGTVLELKSWNSGGFNDDCVSVAWDNDCKSKSSKGAQNINIYRWGALDMSGLPRFDLEVVTNSGS